MPSKEATTGLVVLGTLVVFAVGAWIISNWSGKSATSAKGKAAAKKGSDADSEKPPKSVTKVGEPVVKKAPELVTLEDADSEDADAVDDNDDHNEEEQVSPLPTAEEEDEKKKLAEEMAELRTKYEAANSMAAKLIAGQAHARAAEKLTEIIEMAKKIPEASKDLVKLYNNRSAMYEKMAEYDKGLTDIQVVLALEHLHAKARLRRARIYEAQNKPLLALQDYVLSMIVERFKGQPPSNQEKIEKLSKAVSLEKSASWVKKLRAAGSSTSSAADRPLPSKSYCRMFFERFPNTACWAASAPAELELATQELSTPSGADEWLEYSAKLQLHLSTVCALAAADKFNKAFQLLALLPSYEEVLAALTAAGAAAAASPQLWRLLSLQAELTGSELHLKSCMLAAEKHYRQSIEFATRAGSTAEDTATSSFICSNLKLAIIALELGDRAQATAIYDALLGPATANATATANAAPAAGDEVSTGARGGVAETPGDDDFKDAVSSPPRAAAADAVTPAPPAASAAVNATPLKVLTSGERAWVLLNRIALWEARNDQGAFIDGVVRQGLRDVEEAIALTEDLVEGDVVGKTARFQAFLKNIGLLTQTKQQVGEPTEEGDQERSRACILEARKLFPRHHQILLLEADMLSIEGDSDGALKIVSEAEKLPDVDAVNCKLIKANIITTRAFMEMQSPSGGNPDVVRPLLEEVDGLYGSALEMESNAIEVMAQWAQLKSMLTGDFQGAVELLKRAVPLARSTAEVQELQQLLVMNEAQLKAMTELQQMA